MKVCPTNFSNHFLFLFEQSGVPRTGYKGIVTFMFQKRRVFLAPAQDWNGYDKSWS